MHHRITLRSAYASNAIAEQIGDPEYRRLLGPCFKTGRLKPLCQHPKHVAWANPDRKGVLSSSIPTVVSEPRAITHPERCHIPQAFIRRSKLMLTRPPRSAPNISKVESRPTRLTSNVSLSTISRTVSLSFQSAFHLSLTVLVRYRSLANI